MLHPGPRASDVALLNTSQSAPQFGGPQVQFGAQQPQHADIPVDIFKGVMTTAHPGNAADHAQSVAWPTSGEQTRHDAALRVRRAKQAGGDASMRLSVAESVGPELAKSRAEVAKLKHVVLALSRQNRHLELELERARAAEAYAKAGQGNNLLSPSPSGYGGGGGDLGLSPPSPDATLLAAGAPSPQGALQWPTSAQDLSQLNARFKTLHDEHQMQAKLLADFRRKEKEMEARTLQANQASAYMDGLRAELLPIIAQLKKEHVQGAMWDDPVKLRNTIFAARTSGIAEHKIKHLIKRAEELEAAAGGALAESPYAQAPTKKGPPPKKSASSPTLLGAQNGAPGRRAAGRAPSKPLCTVPEPAEAMADGSAARLRGEVEAAREAEAAEDARDDASIKAMLKLRNLAGEIVENVMANMLAEYS